jgi:hypothetical protein
LGTIIAFNLKNAVFKLKGLRIDSMLVVLAFISALGQDFTLEGRRAASV